MKKELIFWTQYMLCIAAGFSVGAETSSGVGLAAMLGLMLLCDIKSLLDKSDRL